MGRLGAWFERRDQGVPEHVDATIVVYGLPLSGKTTMLQEFAKAHGLKLFCYAHLHYRRMQVFVPVGEKHVEVTTYCGVVWRGPEQEVSYWDEILPRAQSLILALDPQRARLSHQREYVDALLRRSASPTGCVVCTKGDIVSDSEAIEEAIRGTPFASWSRFSCRSDQRSSLLAPIEGSLERLQFRDGGTSSPSEPTRTYDLARELHQRLDPAKFELSWYANFLDFLWDRDMTREEAFALDSVVRVQDRRRTREVVLQRVRGEIRYCIITGEPDLSSTQVINERGSLESLDDAVSLLEEHLLADSSPRKLTTRRRPRGWGE